ncbi:predicted protein, partial [Nematostella vectensis]
RIVILGDSTVGKTCLLLQLCYKSNTMSRKHLESISNNYVANIIVDGKVYKLELCDVDNLDTKISKPFSDTDVFCLCFSVGDMDSFRHVENKWYAEVKNCSPNSPIIVVGTKTDLRENENKKRGKKDDDSPTAIVSVKEGRKMAKKLGAKRYLECSALTQKGYVEVFTEAVKVCVAPKKGKK